MNNLFTTGVAALTLAGSVLALAAPVAAQSQARGDAHAAKDSSGGRSFQGSNPGQGGDASRSFQGARGERSFETASRFNGGERGREGDGGREGWRGGDDRGGWGYPGYGYGYRGFGYGVALGAAIGGTYYGGYPYYGACTGRRTIWDPYYGRYVVRAFRYAC